MHIGSKWLLAASALTLVGACSSASDNKQAPTQTENTAATEQSNPFADAESKMNDAMMAAVGTDAGDSWAKKMIAHHQGAIDMSEAVLQQNPKPDVAAMAREAIDKQKKDIADIQKLVKSGSPDQKSADLYQAAMMDMKQKMQAVTGADINELYMRKMLEHHKGAVAMSDVALHNGVSGAMRQQIQKTRDENDKDSKMTEAMLRGESMQQAMTDSGAKPAAEAAAEPASAEKVKGMPVPGTNTKEKVVHDMNNMGNMDMNKM